MMTHLRPALVLLGLMSILTGLVYPAAVTAIAQLVFPWKAGGSLIGASGAPAGEDDAPVGSALVGQSFDSAAYFWGRPSATSTFPYNAFHAASLTASSGSNLGPTNPALLEGVQARAEALRAADPGNEQPIPVDLVTASGSGLDPHISPAAATYQAGRVARARGIPVQTVLALVDDHVEGRTLGVLGEPRVNVLRLNLELDEVAPREGSTGQPAAGP